MKTLPDFTSLNILVIGDIMLDQYIIGSVDRMSPEAPVPVLNWKDTKLKAGGAANVAMNLKALGANPILCSVMGEDLSGAKLREVLNDEKICQEYIYSDKDRTTTVKTRVMSGYQHLLRIDEEEIEDIDPVIELKLIELIKSIVEKNKIDAILFEDYNKGMITPFLLENVLQLAKKNSIFLGVDPKFRNFGSYYSFDLFKPNLKEVETWLGESFSTSIIDLSKVSKNLREKINFKNLMITLGDKGIFIDDGIQKEIIPAKSLEIMDVCGAGDAVFAISSLCLLQGLSLSQSAKWSNAAGAFTCKQLGVSVPGIADIEKEID